MGKKHSALLPATKEQILKYDNAVIMFIMIIFTAFFNRWDLLQHNSEMKKNVRRRGCVRSATF